MTTAPESGNADLLAPVAPGLSAGAFADRVLGAALGTLEMYAVYFGDRLGWYRTLAEQGPLTSLELSRATGTAERYAREWLEHQAVSGYLTVSDPTDQPQARRYRLPAAHAEVLTDQDSLAHLGPFARVLAATGLNLDDIVEAYRTGGGVSWQQLGVNAREGQSAMNRPLFLHALAQQVVQVDAQQQVHDADDLHESTPATVAKRARTVNLAADSNRSRLLRGRWLLKPLTPNKPHQ